MKKPSRSVGTASSCRGHRRQANAPWGSGPSRARKSVGLGQAKVPDDRGSGGMNPLDLCAGKFSRPAIVRLDHRKGRRLGRLLAGRAADLIVDLQASAAGPADRGGRRTSPRAVPARPLAPRWYRNGTRPAQYQYRASTAPVPHRHHTSTGPAPHWHHTSPVLKADVGPGIAVGSDHQLSPPSEAIPLSSICKSQLWCAWPRALLPLFFGLDFADSHRSVLSYLTARNVTGRRDRVTLPSRSA